MIRNALLITGAVLLGFAMFHFLGSSGDPAETPSLTQEFGEFIRRFNKHYDSLSESALRLQVFSRNLELIRSHNAKGLNFTLGLNEFADLTFEEFSARFLQPAGSMPKTSRLPVEMVSGDIDWPRDYRWIDWSNFGSAVKAVRVQGGLHSSAHMASAALQQALYIKNGISSIPELSVQELSDCVPQDPKKIMVQEDFLYTHRKGLNTESDYPQVGKEMPCRQDMVGKGVYRATSFRSTDRGSKGAIDLLWSQPTTAGMAVTKEFQFYKSGIWNPADCPTEINHNVNLIGFSYNTNWKMTNNHFIGKNCWGTSWGIDGFFFIAMSETTEGVCGITTPGYLLAPLGEKI